MVKVSVKWNKVSFDNIEVDPSQGVAAFKAKIQELTNVPCERQKMMCKGCWTGTLKDDFNLTACALDGATIMLMGTADSVAAPVQVATFVEDLSPDQIAQKGGSLLPAGLQNLGNTCYLNSTLQCLKVLAELRAPLMAGSGLAAALGRVLTDLERSGSAITPYAFLQTLRAQYPQFAEMNHGHFMQQDAEEALNALLSSVPATQLRGVLAMDIEETLTCMENPQEVVVRQEVVNKLVCNIQGGPGAAVNVDHLLDGIKLGLESTIDKHSVTLDRDAKWTKVQRVASLPKHVCVQFLRFFWKATPDSRDHSGVKCKIMRKVAFPETLDLFELCTPALQEILRRNRQRGAAATEGAMDVEPAGDDVGEGLLELEAIVTHRGRSADSGHYKSYVREAPGSRVWRCFDDDKVSEVSTEDVLLLYGNGDSDCAYLCFYRRLEKRR